MWHTSAAAVDLADCPWLQVWTPWEQAEDLVLCAIVAWSIPPPPTFHAAPHSLGLPAGAFPSTATGA